MEAPLSAEGFLQPEYLQYTAAQLDTVFNNGNA